MSNSDREDKGVEVEKIRDDIVVQVTVRNRE